MSFCNGCANLGFNLLQATRADHFADGFFRLKEFVDIRLGKADGLSQVGHCGFLIAVVAEMFNGRSNDLVAYIVVGWAPGRGGRGTWNFHALKFKANGKIGQRVTIWYYGHLKFS